MRIGHLADIITVKIGNDRYGLTPEKNNFMDKD